MTDRGHKLAENSERQEVLQNARSWRYRLFAVKFVATWLLFLVILMGVALLMNLEWARPQIESNLREAFHRQVQLGRLSWRLGLNGLAIATDHLAMTEVTGEPFIKAGLSEIGVAFLPLFQSKVIIKHLDFKSPEVYAVQVAPDKWNFSDLLVDGPEIRMLQISDGKLHLRNEGGTKSGEQPWQHYDFTALNLKMIFPKKDQTWPFYLSFKLPREIAKQAYCSEVQITANGRGPFDQWQHNPYKVEVQAKQINPDDLRPFATVPEGLSGLFEIKFKGEGVLAKGITGVAKAAVENLKISNGTQPMLVTPHASAQAAVLIQPEMFSWKDGVMATGGLKLASAGQVDHWNRPTRKYHAEISGRLINLSELSSSFVNKLLDKSDQDSTTAAQQAMGNAEVELTIDGSEKGHKISTALKAQEIPIASLVTKTTANSPLSFLKLDNSTKAKGEIFVDANERVEVKRLEIPAQGTVVHIDGYLDKRAGDDRINFTASGMKFSQKEAIRLLEPAAGAVSSSNGLLVSGVIDAEGQYRGQRGKNSLSVKTVLKDATLSDVKGQVIASAVTGQIMFDGNSLKFVGVSGTVPGQRPGSFKLNGYSELSRAGKCDLSLFGQEIDLSAIRAVAEAAKADLAHTPALERLSGRVHSIEVKLSGRMPSPTVSFNLLPGEIACAVPELNSDPNEPVEKIHLTGGSISLVGKDNLSFKDILVKTRTGNLTVNALVENISKAPTTKWLRVYSKSVDVSAGARYLTSTAVPTDLRARYDALLSKLKLSDLQGTAYGDVSVVFSKSPKIDGVIGFQNASGKFGDEPAVFEQSSGVVAISEDQLLLQDISTSIKDSEMVVNGTVSNYLSKRPSWKIAATGRIRPQDLIGVVPGIGIANSRNAVRMRSHISGDIAEEKVIFYFDARPRDGLKLELPFVVLHQPPGEGLIVDGSLNIKAGERPTVSINNAHIMLGEAVIQGSGKYEWDAHDPKNASVDFIVKTLTPIPSGVIASMLQPDLDVRGASGSINGTFALSGPIASLLTHGNFNIDQVSIPSLQLANVSGTIDSPRWTIIPASETRPRETVQSQVNVGLAQATWRGLLWKDVKARIVFDTEPVARIRLEDGIADIAAGKMKVNGWYEPHSQKSGLDVILSKLQVADVLPDLADKTQPATGLADAHMKLESQGIKLADLKRNLSGEGDFTVYSGVIPGVGQLHEKLQLGNFLQQGIFGFNFNNLLHTVLPSKSGKFKEVSAHYVIDKGIVTVRSARLEGDDLRLRAAGELNLPEDTLSLDVAGDIPRVASSILPGAVGEMSRSFTLQKVMRLITFNKLQTLPSLPILGDIASDDPRAFTFKMNGPLDTPNTVVASVQKSFKWLPNKPNASAHPVPGL